MSDLKLFRITGPKAVEVHGTGLSEVRRETQHSRRPNRLCAVRRMRTSLRYLNPWTCPEKVESTN